MQTHSLLRHLDAPVRFLSFTMGELAGYLMPFFLGALVDSIFVVPAVGLAVVGGIRKIGKRFPRFYAMRLLYWSLPTSSFNKILRVGLPPSHQRLWIK